MKSTQYGGYIDPMPVYRPPWDGMHDPKVAKYPLFIVTPHPRHRIHSGHDSNPWLKDDSYRHGIWINVANARERGIKDDDLVRVYNDAGEMVIPAYVTSKIAPGVACIYQGAWYRPNKSGVDRRGSPNILHYTKDNPSGAFPYTSLVEVEKF
jgi:anaerobic dimethyl sulfoxide reductase subunit A